MGMDVGESAIADIDNDNDLDIIIIGANGNGHYVTNLYENDGKGNFTIVLNTPFDGARSGSVEFADVDNDTDMDVLISGQHSNYSDYTKLYKNDGDGNFTLVENTSFEAIGYGSITFADIDGDDDLDVLLTGDSITKLYLNDGQGNYSESSNVFPGVTYSYADMADVDGDMDVDIILTGRNTQNRRITKLYINDGTGIFTEDISSSSIFEQVYFSCVFFGDADGDMDNDLLIIGTNTFNQKVTKLYLNDGQGNFSLDTSNSFTGVSSGTVFFADLDNDGDNDIYLAGNYNSSGNKLAKIYENNGGKFTEIIHTSFDLVTTGSAIAKDIDGDSDLDIITTGSTNRYTNCKYVNEFRSSNIFLNQGNMTFNRVSGCSIKDFDNCVFDYADIDSDADVDVVIAGESEDGLRIITYTNDGNGNFSEQGNTLLQGSFFYGTVDLADIDGDNDQDLLITGEDNDTILKTKLYLNNGSGEFEIVSNTPFIGIEYSTSSFFDIDNDGDLDLLLTGETEAYASEARLYKNDGTGTFTEVINIPFEGVRNGSVAISDIDDDNDLDVLIAGSKCVRRDEYNTSCTSGINLYTNDGLGNFTMSSHYPFPNTMNCTVTFADIDNDNDQDLLLTGDGTNYRKYATIFKNNGSGSFSEDTSLSLTGVNEGSVSFGNLDGDEYIDLVIAGYNVDKKEITKLYQNNGNGGFLEVENVTMDGFSRGCVAFMDVDNDGDDDVLTSGSGFTKLYRNTTESSISTDVDAFQYQLANSGNITLAPNPTKGNITINLNSTEKVSIQVFNSFGTICIEDKEVNTIEYNLRINGTPGIYFVKISTTQGEKIIKVIKK